MKKKILFLCTAILLSMSAINAQTWNIGTPTAASVTATLSGNTLTISGMGNMQNFTSATNMPWYSQQGSITTVVIESGVNSIGNYAFYGHSNLSSITIPNGVTTIGMYAFYQCGNLTSVAIPSGVTQIQDYTFWGCLRLASINIPNGVTSIGVAAFSGCSNLTSVTIPSSVTSIFYGSSSANSSNAFYNCNGLSYVISLRSTPIYYPWQSMPHTTLYVPAASATTYRNTLGWNQFAAVRDLSQLPNISVSVSANNSSYGTATIAGDMIEGKYVNQVTLTATPASSAYAFVNWSDGITANPRTIALTQDISLIANFKILSNDTNLQSLTVNKGTLSPPFSSLVTFYVVDVPKGDANQDVYIGATANNAGAKISGDTGLQALNLGSNLFEIKVQAEDAAFQKTYTLLINRDADKIDSLSQEIAAIENLLADTVNLLQTQLNDTVTVLRGQVTSLETAQSVLQSQLITANGTISTLQGQLTTANNNVTTLQEQLTAANNNVATLQGQLTTANNTNNTLQEELNTADNTISSLQTQLATVNNSVNILQDEKNVLQTELNTANGTVGSLQTQLNTANITIVSLQGELTTADNSIFSLESQNTVLQSYIDDLQGKLDECGQTGTFSPGINGLVIYPNPTTGIVYVTEECNIRVFNLHGILLQEVTGTQVDLSAYAKGIYLLQINGAWAKVIKE